jgi:hypothetical protein
MGEAKAFARHCLAPSTNASRDARGRDGRAGRSDAFCLRQGRLDPITEAATPAGSPMPDRHRLLDRAPGRPAGPLKRHLINAAPAAENHAAAPVAPYSAPTDETAANCRGAIAAVSITMPRALGRDARNYTLTPGKPISHRP